MCNVEESQCMHCLKWFPLEHLTESDWDNSLWLCSDCFDKAFDRLKIREEELEDIDLQPEYYEVG